VAREEYGLAGVVQHGASTLPPDYFTVFAGKSVPEGMAVDETLLNTANKAVLSSNPVVEVHLATAYQDTTLDHEQFPAALSAQIKAYILEKYPAKAGEDPNKAFVDNRKNAWGPFKVQVWNLPAGIQETIRVSLKTQFDTVFNNLGVKDSRIILAEMRDTPKVAPPASGIKFGEFNAFLKPEDEARGKPTAQLNMGIPSDQGASNAVPGAGELGMKQRAETLNMSVEKLTGYLAAGNTVYRATGGRAFSEYTATVANNLGDRPLALIVTQESLRMGGMNNVLRELNKLSSNLKVVLCGEKAGKLQTLVGNQNIIIADTLDDALSQLAGMPSENIFVLKAPGEQIDETKLAQRKIRIVSGDIATLVVAKAVKELVVNRNTDIAFEYFLSEIEGEVIEKISDDTRIKLIEKLDSGTYAFPEEVKATEQVAKDIKVAELTVSTFVDQI